MASKAVQWPDRICRSGEEPEARAPVEAVVRATGAIDGEALYTNNKLTPAAGFEIPADHLTKFDILRTSVGTDPELTMRTRRGTGYYKVPSLKGVWYRSMFGHSGWCATLEDWFDPRRVREDYPPIGSFDHLRDHASTLPPTMLAVSRPCAADVSPCCRPTRKNPW
ncbi:MAG TPA: hypothetical protein VHI99_02915 [Vicinamibacterales bacterium]|nr:hypothetical protein [Vicinamibacterales bacterium]